MDSIINYITGNSPTKLAERGVDAFKQIHYNAMADALAALDVEKFTTGIVLILYVPQNHKKGQRLSGLPKFSLFY